MQFHKQTLLHKPGEGQQGDCYRTALACLLDADPQDVPHFMADPDEPVERTWKRVDLWLQENYGLRRLEVPLAEKRDEWLSWYERNYPGLRYLLSGSSARGFEHVVVVESGKVIWDPHPDGDGELSEPSRDGNFWLTFLVPVNIHGGCVA